MIPNFVTGLSIRLTDHELYKQLLVFGGTCYSKEVTREILDAIVRQEVARLFLQEKKRRVQKTVGMRVYAIESNGQEKVHAFERVVDLGNNDVFNPQFFWDRFYETRCRMGRKMQMVQILIDNNEFLCSRKGFNEDEVYNWSQAAAVVAFKEIKAMSIT